MLVAATTCDSCRVEDSVFPSVKSALCDRGAVNITDFDVPNWLVIKVEVYVEPAEFKLVHATSGKHVSNIRTVPVGTIVHKASNETVLLLHTILFLLLC